MFCGVGFGGSGSWWWLGRFVGVGGGGGRCPWGDEEGLEIPWQRECLGLEVFEIYFV